ncbi:DUF1571 domain-containing protein [Edaphovirga cremea]|uniref:DUF1571 domain-containing protein n=1 Tax=Edaphovirga cremea TaxID=2267246 RepID=UPI001FE79CED|nr:DUF1571 domain-containing protein [Edaphovirga cremea]
MIPGFTAFAANETDKIRLPPRSDNTTDPIILAQQHFDQMGSYQVRILSTSAKGERNNIRYSYRKPGYVRMDFTEPHPGAVLVYNPSTNAVRLWPFGIGKFPVLNLSPTNSLIRDQSGHRVDQSDIGTLLRNIHSLQQSGGKTTVIGNETLPEQSASSKQSISSKQSVSSKQSISSNQSALHVSIRGPQGVTVSNVHRYEIWLESSHDFPLKVVSYDVNDQLMESVLMDAIVVNVHFPADFFTP